MDDSGANKRKRTKQPDLPRVLEASSEVAFKRLMLRCSPDKTNTLDTKKKKD